MQRVSVWIVIYLGFIGFALYIAYYLNAIPPSSNEINHALLSTQITSQPDQIHPSQWQPVTLPDINSAKQLQRNEIWYKLEIPSHHTNAEQPTTHQWAIYIPSLSHNIELFINGYWLGNGGSMDHPVDRNFNNPLIFNLDHQLLKPSNNYLYIRVKGTRPAWTYLGRVYIGKESLLKPIYNQQKLLRVNLVIFTTIALIFTSLFTFFLWLLRRNETYYLWYSIAEILWAIHDTNRLIKRIPVSDAAWESIVPLCIGWSLICFFAFIHRYTGSYNHLIDRAILTTGAVLTLPFLYQDLEWVVFYGYKVWLLFVAIAGVYSCFFMFRHYFQSHDKNTLLMIMASMIMFGFGAHDLLAVYTLLPLSSPYIMYFSAFIIILVISTLLIQRFVASLHVVEHFNETLQHDIALKEKQLKQEYQKRQTLQKQQILSQERERFMRDIHDGIGGQLVTVLAATERSDITLPEVQIHLKSAIQDLRLVIDSLDGDEQELPVILGTLRSRLSALLKQADIKLHWQVKDTPELEAFGPEKSLNTMRIFQEAVTNVIKHSQATELTVSTYKETIDDKDYITVAINDNGNGQFGDVQGRGLLNMKARARKMGALIAITSVPKTGTWVKLHFYIPL